jgi:hypothetical protein
MDTFVFEINSFMYGFFFGIGFVVLIWSLRDALRS